MKTAFLFSGQGAQYPGMMKDIADIYTEAMNIFTMADKTLNRSISEICFNGTQDELNLTHNTQPCVLAADLAAYAALSKHGIKADAVAGFSLGEYAAMVAAEAVELKDVFQVVQKRADYMQEAVPVGMGGMAAIMKQSKENVEILCTEAGGYVIPANFNCPGQIVVSGEMSAIDNLCEIAKKQKIKAVKLPVSAPFHCKMMEPAAKKLEMVLENVKIKDPVIPCYSNVTAKPYSTKQEKQIRELLCQQAMSPVLWEQTLQNLYEDGIRCFIELGPGKTLSSFVKKTLTDVETYSINSIDTLREYLDSRVKS